MRELTPVESEAWSNVQYDALLDSLKRLKVKLEDHGLRVSAGSRLDAYQRSLEKALAIAEGTKPPRDFDVRLFHHSLFEAEQIGFIVDQLSQPPEVLGWSGRLQSLLSGQADPADESSQTPGRDLQFELFMAALSRAGDYRVSLAEPDVVVRHSELPFGIAAKRPKSLARLDKTVKKARKQIVHSSYDGVVALDISLLQNPESEFAIVTKRELAAQAIRHFADYFLEHNEGRIRSLINSNRVFGVVIYMSALFFDRAQQRPGSTFHISPANLCPDDDRRAYVLQEYVQQLAKAITRGWLERGAI